MKKFKKYFDNLIPVININTVHLLPFVSLEHYDAILLKMCYSTITTYVRLYGSYYSSVLLKNLHKSQNVDSCQNFFAFGLKS